MHETYDIAVVGGGPAGLSAAFKAASLGAHVVLFEKDPSIAHNIRTSGVTWIDEIEKLGINSSHYNPIQNYAFISPSNKVMIKGKRPQACVLNVRSAYQHLALLATEAGAEIKIKSSVSGSITDGKQIIGLKVNTPEGLISIKCALVIDASGFSSIIGRRSGLAKEWKRYGVGAEYECVSSEIDPLTWYLMVGSRYSNAGYGWLFPLSKNRFRIGIGIGRPESNVDPLERLNEIMSKKLSPLDKISRINPVELHYGFIPNEGTRTTTVDDGLILVGDSAGQSNPLVLEGIRYAIEYGRLAGEIGARSLTQNSSRDSLYEYERIWKSRLESKINSAYKVQERWLGLTDDQWDSEIDILKSLSGDEFLDFIKANFTPSKMLKLALNHPKLAARQLFKMILK